MTILKDAEVPNCLSHNAFWIFNFHLLIFFVISFDFITYIWYIITIYKSVPFSHSFIDSTDDALKISLDF